MRAPPSCRGLPSLVYSGVGTGQAFKHGAALSAALGPLERGSTLGVMS